MGKEKRKLEDEIWVERKLLEEESVECGERGLKKEEEERIEKRKEQWVWTESM